MLTTSIPKLSASREIPLADDQVTICQILSNMWGKIEGFFVQAERYSDLFEKLWVFHVRVPKDDLNKHMWLIITIANLFLVPAAHERSYKQNTIKTSPRSTG